MYPLLIFFYVALLNYLFTLVFLTNTISCILGKERAYHLCYQMKQIFLEAQDNL